MNSKGQHESLNFGPEDSRPLMAQENWDEEDPVRLQKKPAGVSTAQKVFSAISSLRHIVNTALLIAILAFLLVTRYHKSRGQLDSSGDITGFSPTCE
jgi:hypothetical protein